MSGIAASPAYRRFVNDLRDPRCIPAVDAPEIAALEAERQRLVAALEEAERSGPHAVSDDAYIVQRTRALREGGELPEQPPTGAELTAGHERRRRDVAAAEEALLRLGDLVCQTVAAHPEWEDAARSKVKAAQDEAAEMRQRAKDAERRAEDAGWLVQHLERTAADELYVARVSADSEPMPWVHIDVDPSLVALARSGQPL